MPSELTDVTAIAARAVDECGPPVDLEMDEYERAAFSEWLHTDGYQVAALAAQEHVKRQADRGYKANNGYTLGRAKRSLIRAIERGEWRHDTQTIGGDKGRAMMESLPHSASQSPPYAPGSSGHCGGEYDVDARDWWEATKGGLSNDVYNACVCVFGLDGHDELGYEGAADALGVCEMTVRRWVGAARGGRGRGVGSISIPTLENTPTFSPPRQYTTYSKDADNA